MRKFFLTILVVIFSNTIYAQNDLKQIRSTPSEINAIENKLTLKILDYKSSIDTSSINMVGKDSVPKQKMNFIKRITNYFSGSNTDKTYKKKLDISIIGGPNYSKETAFSVGLFAAGLYRTDFTDPLLQPSNISLFGNISTTGFYLIGVKGNHFFPGRKHRLSYTGYLFSFPSGYWGTGYENGYGAVAGKYKRFNSIIKADYLYTVAKNFSVGVVGSIDYVSGKNWDENAWKLFKELPEGTKTAYTSIGIGALLVYDSRDFMLNASKGQYLKAEQKFYPRFLGNGKESSFSSTEFTFSTYHKLWKGAILAYDLHALFTYGNTPWSMYATTGGSYRMRGYYEGRYRDKNAIETQLELRQNIWRRIGVVGWVGVGNVFSSFSNFKINQTLLNYGVGLRWEFKHKVNVRIDYGFGTKDAFGQRSSAFIFSINEAF